MMISSVVMSINGAEPGVCTVTVTVWSCSAEPLVAFTTSR
jgi:hypothetical protein